ncbi:MAG: A/G-specific adenine glycosylase [Clostridia bacterium]|nr:A/G-specific adenine glycosylase [Clostridia bacterium]
MSMNQILQKLPALLLPWYAVAKRDLPWRKTKDPYFVWLSEIMLQQTRVEAVRDYFLRFTTAFPSIEALANANIEEVLKVWEGLGYYSRARNLHKAAGMIVRDFGGIFPIKYKDILSLPGIGEYTAGAISSICFEQPTPAVDGNVLRVHARIMADERPVQLPAVKKDIQRDYAVCYQKGHCGDLTQALMELGAVICIPRSPHCIQCPLSTICTAYAKNIVEKLPVKLQKRARRTEELTVFFLTADGDTAVRKRAASGLLAGLWELPNVPGKLSAADAVKKAEAWGLAPDAPLRVLSRTHIFTHVEWHMTCYFIPCKQKSADFCWTSTTNRTLPLPTAFRIFWEGED